MTSSEYGMHDTSFFRQLVESSTDMISKHDAEGRYLYASPYCSVLLGYDPDELVGHSAYEFFCPDDVPAIEESHRSIQQTGEVRTVSYRIRHKKGHYVWVETTSRFLESAAGRGPEIIATTRNIEERKSIERKLLASEAQLKQSQSVAQIGHYVFDVRSGRWTSSEALDEIFGIDSGYERTVEGWSALIHPEHRLALLKYLSEDVLQHQLDFDREYMIVRLSDGRTRWVHGLGKLELAADGTVARMFGTIRDITEQKELRLKQEFLKKRLQALWNISSLIHADFQTICDNILEEIVGMTASSYGFYGFMNETEEALTIFSWSKKAMSDCAIHDKPIIYSIDESGIWGNAVRARRPFIMNDYRDVCENKRGLPEGHVALTRVLSVPIEMSGKIVAVAAVANKETHYTEEDIAQLEAFLKSVQILIERKKIEDALAESEEHYRILFDKAAHGSAVADAETGIIIDCNAQMAKLVGRSVRELIGQHQSILYPQTSAGNTRATSFERHLGDNEGQLIEDRLIDQDGNIIDVEIKANRMKLGGRDVIHGVFYDISERKRMLEEYRRATQLAALGTVAAGVAHEINNPIQGIMNYATLISSKPANADHVKDIADRIMSESERIAEITRELLDFARDNRHHNELCDLEKVVESALDLIEKKTLRRGISIETRYDDNLPQAVVNPQSIQQIVINLVDNASDALEDKEMPLDEKVIKVSCYLEREGEDDRGSVCLEVSDRGVGMSEETRQRAGETFFSTKPSTRGTGLGLSIVNDLVNRHNGTVSIESRENEFTRVKVLLPVTPHVS